MTGGPAPPSGDESVIGVRTGTSDRVVWARWTGPVPAVIGQWVVLMPSGDVGRVTIPADMLAIDSSPAAERQTATPHDPAEDTGAPEPAARNDGRWGRIGHGGSSAVAMEGEPRSREGEAFRRLMAGVPALGERVETPQGAGVVSRVDPFAGTVEVRTVPGGDELTLPIADVERAGPSDKEP